METHTKLWTKVFECFENLLKKKERKKEIRKERSHIYVGICNLCHECVIVPCDLHSCIKVECPHGLDHFHATHVLQNTSK